mmetsp:Transcript_101627/g.258390  ORF Transcript_101627/g.258390 Transcript_101627/m.258390 type:complete len:454 (-) Transcript_101627:42-1403(-)
MELFALLFRPLQSLQRAARVVDWRRSPAGRAGERQRCEHGPRSANDDEGTRGRITDAREVLHGWLLGRLEGARRAHLGQRRRWPQLLPSSRALARAHRCREIGDRRCRAGIGTLRRRASAKDVEGACPCQDAASGSRAATKLTRACQLPISHRAGGDVGHQALPLRGCLLVDSGSFLLAWVLGRASRHDADAVGCSRRGCLCCHCASGSRSCSHVHEVPNRSGPRRGPMLLPGPRAAKRGIGARIVRCRGGLGDSVAGGLQEIARQVGSAGATKHRVHFVRGPRRVERDPATAALGEVLSHRVLGRLAAARGLHDCRDFQPTRAHHGQGNSRGRRVPDCPRQELAPSIWPSSGHEHGRSCGPYQRGRLAMVCRDPSGLPVAACRLAPSQAAAPGVVELPRGLRRAPRPGPPRAGGPGGIARQRCRCHVVSEHPAALRGRRSVRARGHAGQICG